MFVLLALLLSLSRAAADADLDSSRTGSYYTDYLISRSSSGSNTVKVRVGTPGVDAQLTLCESQSFYAHPSYQCQLHSSRCVDLQPQQILIVGCKFYFVPADSSPARTLKSILLSTPKCPKTPSR
jgi:hypothetical protein